MAAISAPHHTGREFFIAPAGVNQRRYEALRAYYAEDLTLAAAGQRLGYTRATMASLVRDFRAGRLQLFAPPGKPGRKSAPATAGRDTRLPRVKVIDVGALPERASTAMAGLLLMLPDVAALDLPGLVAAAGYPGTAVVPATGWLLCLLALKLTNTRRVSHVDDLLCDPAT